jgi:hypothetical protein
MRILESQFSFLITKSHQKVDFKTVSSFDVNEWDTPHPDLNAGFR